MAAKNAFYLFDGWGPLFRRYLICKVLPLGCSRVSHRKDSSVLAGVYDLEHQYDQFYNSRNRGWIERITVKERSFHDYIMVALQLPLRH